MGTPRICYLATAAISDGTLESSYLASGSWVRTTTLPPVLLRGELVMSTLILERDSPILRCASARRRRSSRRPVGDGPGWRVPRHHTCRSAGRPGGSGSLVMGHGPG